MKILKTEVLVSKGDFVDSDEFKKIINDVYIAIRSVTWPPESDIFTLNPVKKGSGVKPIKNNCMNHLETNGWQLEYRMSLGSRIKPGPIDAVKQLSNGLFFAVEWETGNISSSHRAINKLAIGLIDSVLAGGILILPSRNMYKFLTDRIGNFPEIEPYFPMWKNMRLESGYLAVIEIEHDELSTDAPFIPKGSDGWALINKG